MQNSRLWGHTDHANTIYSIRMHQNVLFFMKERPTMAVFWSKVGIFGLPPILRSLDAKKQIVGTHRSRKHNLQHPYEPNFPFFMKWPFFCQILIFWLCTSS